MPSDEIVTPSCIDEMNLGGSLVIRPTARARRLPACSSSRMRVRRDVTSPYSAATKNALSKSRPTRASSSRTRFTGWRTRLVRAYWAADRRPREVPGEYTRRLRRHERMFYAPGVEMRRRVEYREEPCRSALNRVRGMPFDWTLNPYMGCVHRCTFCYVRGFEQRADRPADDRYGTSIRVKVNIAEVLRCELAAARRSADTTVAIGAATDPVPACRGPLPAHPRLPRGAGRSRRPVLDHHPQPADRARRRRPGRGGAPRRRLGHVLGAHARRERLAVDRAGNRAARGSGCGRCRVSSRPV